MKLKMKVLALAILAASANAQAAIDSGVTGNSSLFLTILDRSSNISFLADLGKNYSDFNIASTEFANSGVTNPGTSFTWDMKTADWGTIFSQFVASSNVANWQWGVAAYDSLGSGTGTRGQIISYTAIGTTLPTNQVSLGNGNYDTYSSGNTVPGTGGNVVTNLNAVANGAAIGNSGLAYAGVAYNPAGKFGGQTGGAISLQAVGLDAGVIQNLIGGSPLAASTVTIFGNGAKFNLASNGVLTYSTTPLAPIPEADAWLMMLLGLGFMGYSATRKAV